MRLRNQTGVKDFLERLHREGKIPGSLLFYGPPGVGKTSAALDFAKGILCLEGAPWGCGECASCRHVEKFAGDVTSGRWEEISVYEEIGGKNVFVYLMGEHPDLIYVPPSGTGIKIDQIRALKEFSYVRPALSRSKVVLIDDAHKLTKESGNALLKVLEEPPVDTVFILISEGKESLLPTILSRTFQIEFPPLEESIFYELLGREDREIYELSRGSLTLARDLLEKKEVLGLVDSFLSLKPDKVYEVALKLDKMDDRERELFLNVLEERVKVTYLKKGINYDRFEMIVRRISELRNGLGRGLRFSLGLLTLYSLWR